MASPQQKPLSPTTYNIGVREEAASASCFRRFCCGWDDGEDPTYLLQDEEGREGAPHKESWIVTKLKKLMEFPDLVAGPKWKNLIRKPGKIWNPRRHGCKVRSQFQYLTESYALNFAGDDNGEEDGNLSHSFSTRFAPGSLINDRRKGTQLCDIMCKNFGIGKY